MTRKISESDTRANFIDPKLVESQWESINIIREYGVTVFSQILLTICYSCITLIIHIHTVRYQDM